MKNSAILLDIEVTSYLYYTSSKHYILMVYEGTEVTFTHS